MTRKSISLDEAWDAVDRLLHYGYPNKQTEKETNEELFRCLDGELQPQTFLRRAKKRLDAQHANDKPLP